MVCSAPRRASSVRKGPSQRQPQAAQPRRRSVSLGRMQAAHEDVDAEFEALAGLKRIRNKRQLTEREKEQRRTRTRRR